MKIVKGLVALLLTLAVYMGVREISSRSHASELAGERLAIRWEGAVIDRNSRDLAESLNACLGKPLYRPGVVHRANVWFSGWSCEGVGNPDVILSLNRNKKRGERYYCEGENGPVVGRFFQEDELVLENLEFLETWDKPEVRPVACAFFKEGLAEIAAGKKVLAHCDAGKDRTGTFSALVAAASAERQGLLNAEMIAAIECDYRKSESLEKDKYGRMTALLTKLQEQGGVARFFEGMCGIDVATLDRVSDRLLSLAE